MALPLKIDTVRPYLNGQWLQVLAALVPELDAAIARKGRHVACPVHGGRDGFRLFKDAEYTGGGVCNTCGIFHDGFELLSWINGWNFAQSIEAIGQVLGIQPGQIQAPTRPIPSNAVDWKAKKQDEDKAIIHRLNQTWGETLSLADTRAQPVWNYLHRRGIVTRLRPEWDSVLRFHPTLPYHDEDGLFIDSIKEHFIQIHDDRQSAKVDYPLFDILFGSLCAIMAGGLGWTDIREYVMGHHEWFLKHKLFENGVPVDDTFAHLLSSIKPEAFQECFLNWMRSVHKLTQGEVVAIDGKTLRGSYNRSARGSTIHMISAYASANQLVLGQLKTVAKSNEITAIPALIKMLELRGALVTINAMAYQTNIVKTILEQGADYLLAVKGNQGRLSDAIKAAFALQRQAALEAHDPLKLQRSRVELRTSHVLDANELIGYFSGCPGLKSIVMVEYFRAEKGKSISLEQHYYICSKELTSSEAGDAVRAHWGIESMHWILDVSLREDACQIYRDNAAENLAGLRIWFSTCYERKKRR